MLPNEKPASYRAMLTDPRWQKRRLEVLSRDDFECRMCGANRATLHVHHLRYTRGAPPWSYRDRELVTLCEGCHETFHDMRPWESIVEALLQGGITDDSLWGLLGVLEVAFHDRGTRLNVPEWDEFVSLIANFLKGANRAE